MTEYVSGRLRLEAPSVLSAAEIRVLPAMPLHAITSVYGEAGLEQRLLFEIADLPAADRRRVDLACTFMSLVHADDRRQREPYANHPLRVAIRILSHYRVRDPDVACAALLHDTVEDHAADFAAGTPQGALRALARMFGARTAVLVEAVTNPTWEPGRDRDEQYREHVAASLEACPWARVIKASDFTDNAVGLFHTSGPKLARLAGKYRPLGPVLRELILRPDTPLDPGVKDKIAAQLDDAEDRFAAILR
jgi:hypothetical protein